MKKLLLTAALAGAMATPAFAASLTIKFENSDGTVSTITLDDATGTATNDKGEANPYTYDEASKKLCGTNEGAEICVTFENTADEPAVGFSTPYTTSAGGAGTATITAISE